ncbi:App1 family protein [Xylanimonas ulmi]|uniref:Phosphatidate phosphatase APP1 n=1 Tax=Xylanimonas ulmi TaxID=228973 RepID=A0A4Q7M6K5_9MICO|nr:phosphatase domain-containing protein [Xylanibacterium ulmi]RZS62713.1 phosphatidate phosphatase APP1 [Xylanibacterium ulmi]
MSERPEHISPSTADGKAASRAHVAAIIEDRVIAALGALLRGGAGWLPRVEPYTGFGTPRRVRVLARVLLSPRRLGHGAPRPVQRGFRTFLTLPAPGRRVIVTVGDTVVEAVSDRAGYIDVEVDLPTGAPLEPGWQRATLRTTDPYGVEVHAGLVVVGDDARLGVISDIDDTAMVTAVPTLFVAAWNMLWVRAAARRAVRGMAELYASVAQAHPDAPFVYLSAGAWNTARTLRRFLARHGYPPGPLLLTDFGPTQTGWFRSGRQHKTTSLERLFATFPQVRWLLVGDDGQQDPEIYAQAAREHPDTVLAIGIRTMSRTERVIATAGAAKDRRPGEAASSAASRTEQVAAAVRPVVTGRDGEELAAGLATVPGLLDSTD